MKEEEIGNLACEEDDVLMIRYKRHRDKRKITIMKIKIAQGTKHQTLLYCQQYVNYLTFSTSSQTGYLCSLIVLA